MAAPAAVPAPRRLAVPERELLPWTFAFRRNVLSRARFVQLLILLALLIGWQITSDRVGKFFLAPPSDLVSAFRVELSSGALAEAVSQSAASLLLGFALGAVIGITVGVLMGMYPTVATVINPFVTAGYVLPAAAIVPLLIVWFGIGLTPRVIAVVLFCVFEILITSYTGVRTVDPTLIDMAKSFGAERFRLFQKVIFLAALPNIFAGLRMGAARATKGMIIAELLFAATGIGGAIQRAANAYRTDRVFVYIVVLIIVGLALAALVGLCERWILGSRARPRHAAGSA
jgi:ABC-type nitrate/sulfonate/bicarbonate transport system permease component